MRLKCLFHRQHFAVDTSRCRLLLFAFADPYPPGCVPSQSRVARTILTSIQGSTVEPLRAWRTHLGARRLLSVRGL